MWTRTVARTGKNNQEPGRARGGPQLSAEYVKLVPLGRDVRVKHTFVLEDPYDDPPQLAELIPDASPMRDRPEDEVCTIADVSLLAGLLGDGRVTDSGVGGSWGRRSSRG
jgi:hypothetical protein